jgi:hypothetical protein
VNVLNERAQVAGKVFFVVGIKLSGKKMRLLDNQRKTTVLKQKLLKYIERYRKIYRGG